MKSLYRFYFLIFVVTPLLTACSMFLPKSYEGAEQDFASGRYKAAISGYKQADREKPGNKDIVAGLLKSNAYLALDIYEGAVRLPAEDLDNRINKLQEAVSYCRDASGYFKSLLSIKPVDPSKVDPLPSFNRLPSEKAEIDYPEKMMCYRKGMSSLVADISSTLNADKAHRQRIIEGVAAAAALMPELPEGPIEAYKAFKPFEKYAAYMDYVAKAKRAIEATVVNFYETRGLALVEKNVFATAKQDFNASLKVIENNHQGKAGLLAIGAQQAINAGKYDSAYRNLLDIKAIHPQSPYYLQYNTQVRRVVVEQGLAKAEALNKTPNSKNQLLMFGLFAELASVAEPIPALVSAVSQAKESLQEQIAGQLLAKADKLSKESDYLYAETINTLIKTAAQFSPAQALVKKPLATRTMAIAKIKQNLPVVFYTHAPQKTSLQDWYNGEILDMLAAHDLSTLKPLSPFDHGLSDIGLADKGILAGKLLNNVGHELVFKLRVKEHQFKEVGRNRPKRVRSKYVSEHYWVPNPQKAIARRELDRAQERKEAADIAAIALYNECKSQASSALGGGFLADMAAGAGCKMGTNALTRAVTGYNTARDKYNNTPAQLEKKTISSYSFNEYAIGVEGRLAADLVLYDLRNKQSKVIDTLVVKVNKKGTKRENVKAEDVNNFSNGEFDVPDLRVLVQEAEEQLLNSISGKIDQHVVAHNSRRFCDYGERMLKSKKTSYALEAFAQCVSSASDQGHQSVVKAKQQLTKYIGFSQSDIEKYRRAAENALTVEPLQLSEAEHQKAQLHAIPL